MAGLPCPPGIAVAADPDDDDRDLLHPHLVLQLLGYGMEERDVLASAPSPWSVPILTGCGTLVPADCYRQVGLYDDRWFPQYHADSEFVLRASLKGYRAKVDLDAVVWNDARNTSSVTRGGFKR